MKKLFLTSAVALCVACPAFADPQIPANAEGATCNIGTLGTAENNGTAAYEAVWNPVSYTISFAAGTAGSRPANYVEGSTASITSVTFDDAAFNLTANGFTATGYNFAGWSSTVNLETGADTATTYSNQEEISPYRYAGSPTLTATWTPKHYAVTYDPGAHGTGGVTYAANASGDVTFDSNYTTLAPGAVLTPVVANTGYTFAGWSDGTSTHDSGYTYSPYTTDGALTLTAQWTANTTTVAYNCGRSNASTPVAGSWTRPNGWAADTQTATYDQPFSHPTGADVCSLTGYTFNAWVCVTGTTPATTNGLAGNGITNNNWAVDNANVICTATWTPHSINLTWTPGAGTEGGTDGAPNCTYDTAINPLPSEPTKTGYTFGGWQVTSTTPSGN